METQAKELSGATVPPALQFTRMIGLNRTKHFSDAVWLVHSLNDDTLKRSIEVCSGYSPEVRKVVAQSIARGTDDDDLEQFVGYHVEAAPALEPFYNQTKHRFNDQRHADLQIGEWSEQVYRHFNTKTPYPFHRDLIRGHALIFYISGPSGPRNAAVRNRELLKWIGTNAGELGKHYAMIEDRKIYDRDFLEGLIASPAAALNAGLL